MTQAAADPRIAHVLVYIERHLGQSLSAEDLARSVGLRPSQFRALFARHTGMSPGRYLQSRRLVRARLLLERTFLTVRQVRDQVGYLDPSHFSRDFHREYGVSPKAVRGRQVAVDSPRANRARPHS